MSTSALTLSDPFHKRFLAWMDERFPAANSVVVIVLYLVCASVARYAAGDDALALKLTDVVGALATWSMFLLLRVADEHKDYELDVKNYPDRVLQSGMITLTHLKLAGLAAATLQLCWSYTIGDGAVTAWIIMMVWAALMTAEFFCGEWLEKRLTLYAVSHMAIMPLVIWWIVNLAVPGTTLNGLVISLMLLAFVSGFCFEITRKTRGPEEERDSVDSYTKIYGVSGCTAIILSLLAIMALIQIYLLQSIVTGGYWVGIVLVLAVIGLAVKSVLSFRSQPTLPGREKNEKMVGLAMIGGYLVVVSAVIVERGLTLSLI